MEQAAKNSHGVSIPEDIKDLTDYSPGKSALDDPTLSRRVD